MLFWKLYDQDFVCDCLYTIFFFTIVIFFVDDFPFGTYRSDTINAKILKKKKYNNLKPDRSTAGAASQCY